MSAHAIFVEFTPTLKKIQPRQWGNLRSLEQCGPWVQAALNQISDFEMVPPENGTSTELVHEEAAKSAIRLLSKAPTMLLPTPSISAIPGGGIGFHWRSDQRDLELEIEASGAIGYLKTDLSQSKPRYEEGPLVKIDDDQFWAWLTDS